ncbi:glycoside hydrolase family 25 protein [Montanilutibacter psychrotolerans]|uniref:Glycoside hydrolase n=1 Tax=Montanilutibacter psychrotolerans TaxID=1327343 RepID=A0A3M8SQM4_9GAMM|nr:glycoside hydrolase family 25 protein [Lysobacter psychrotolerans]RNF83083.1 glycoside hydrolase [Lysobacter psychrotolerans]
MLNAVIDISHHNQISSFDTVRQAGILGVIHKATQGSAYVDPTFADNRKRIQDAGLLFGAYHFGTAGDADAQAERLLAVAGTDALLVLDFESNPQGGSMTLDEAEQFVHHIYHATGRYPGLYSGSTIKQALSTAGITGPSQTELSKCWLWLAQYAATPLIPKAWSTWTLWQYTDGAAGNGPYEVSGVGRCDRDQFNGTADQLQAFWRAGTAASSNVPTQQQPAMA